MKYNVSRNSEWAPTKLLSSKPVRIRSSTALDKADNWKTTKISIWASMVNNAEQELKKKISLSSKHNKKYKFD